MSLVDKLVRKNIKELVPYSSAREEYSGASAIFFDANENPFDSGTNRYPDPLQVKLKQKISELKHIGAEHIFLGNGSDEPIDLLIRAFCEPGTDNIISIKPTYGMYKVCADINNVTFREVLLTTDYQIDRKGIVKATDRNSKLLFLCSPNNPTSNILNRDDILYMIKVFNGLVIVDEAYNDYSGMTSLLDQLKNYPNLVILQTFSKAWGMAGMRLGMAFASKEIIAVLTKIKYPYNINLATQQVVLDRIKKPDEKESWVRMILEQRAVLRGKLEKLNIVKNILHSDSNFLMVRFVEPQKVYQFLIARKIILRDRTRVPLCEGCLRITVGTPEENDILINALQEYDV